MVSAKRRAAPRPVMDAPCVWAHYGPVDSDAPWYGLEHSRIVPDSPHARDPRWWRAELGRVSLSLDLYPAGMTRAGSMRWPVRLGFWHASDDLDRLPTARDVITVIAPNGARWRAVRVQGDTVDHPIYAVTDIRAVGA